MQGINHQTRLKKALVDDPFHQLFNAFCIFLYLFVAFYLGFYWSQTGSWIFWWRIEDGYGEIGIGFCVHHPADGSRGVNTPLSSPGWRPAVLDTAKKSSIKK